MAKLPLDDYELAFRAHKIEREEAGLRGGRRTNMRRRSAGSTSWSSAVAAVCS